MKIRRRTGKSVTAGNRARRFFALFIAVTMMVSTVVFGFDGVYSSEDYGLDVYVGVDSKASQPQHNVYVYVEGHYLPGWAETEPYPIYFFDPVYYIDLLRIESRPGYEFDRWEFFRGCCCDNCYDFSQHFNSMFIFEDEGITAWGWVETRFQLAFVPLPVRTVYARAVWRQTATSNLPCNNTNLARQESVVMHSSSDAPPRFASNANNGILTPQNGWSASGVGEEWLKVDFGEVQNFNHIRLYQASTRIANYVFEYSIDGDIWTPFHDGMRMMDAHPTPYLVTSLTTIQARYVRLTSGQAFGNTTPIVVIEFEVYYLEP